MAPNHLLPNRKRDMLSDILKDKRFNVFFSFVVGLFVAVLARPAFNKEKTMFFKTPPMSELREHSYKVGNKCFKFHPEEKACPANGVVEPFQWNSRG
jgi:hypothetical protein